MNERIDRTRRTYDRVASRFLANTRDRSRMAPWLGRFAERLGAGARVLDLGSGPGCDSAELRRRGLRAVSLDLSLGMLRAGLPEFPGARVQADARRLPLRDGCMAGVWANASLLHLSPEEAAAALREARRVLGNGGLLHVSVKSGDGADWESERYGEARWFQYWSAANLDALLAHAGFRVVAAASESTPRADWLVRHAMASASGGEPVEEAQPRRMSVNIEWPEKSRELHNHHFDSTIWNDLSFRDDDIVISTYAKAGTTWMQQIVGQLLFDGDPDLAVAEMSPWLDLRVPPKAEKLPVVEAQAHRRFLKTHLPVDALRFSPNAKYIYIGRDGRDVVWSMYNHHANANESWYLALNETPGRVGPPIERPPGDVRQYWRDWMDRDGHPFWPFWENVRSWWRIRHLPNVRFVHFAKLKGDMPGEIRRIAEFLEIPIREERWDAILEHCSFEWMKRNATRSVPLGGAFWDAGAEVFIHKGVNGRWRDTLSAAESAEYERRAEAELGAECARWLATGEGSA